MNSDGLKYVLRKFAARPLLDSWPRELSLPTDSGKVIGLSGVRQMTWSCASNFEKVTSNMGGVPEKNADGETANSWEYCRQWIDRGKRMKTEG